MDGANDPNVLVSPPKHPAKLLGVLMIEPALVGFDYADEKVQWDAGDPYLDITVPPIPKDMLGPESLRESMYLTAQYVGLNGLHAYTGMKFVGGLTSKRFAQVAERTLGFSVAQVDPSQLPAPYVEGAKGIYETFVGNSAKVPFEPAFIYHTPESILTQYADADPELAALATAPLPRKYDYVPILDPTIPGAR